MSHTLIDYYLGFDKCKEQRHFSAGVQATYYALLSAFNRAHYPRELELSLRELQSRAGLKSVSGVYESRNVLKNHRLIDFRTVEGRSVYELKSEHLPNNDRTKAEQLANSNRTGRVRFKDACAEEAKKEEAEKEHKARERGGEEVGEIDWREYAHHGRLAGAGAGGIGAFASGV